jgi:hypothetical protein
MNDPFDRMFDNPNQVAQRLDLTLADEDDEDEGDSGARGLRTSGLRDMGNGCFLRTTPVGFGPEGDFDMSDR